MDNEAQQAILGEKMAPRLEKNIESIKTLFHCPLNRDCIIRELTIGDFSAALVYTDGMAAIGRITEGIIRPCLSAHIPEDLKADQRSDYLCRQVLGIPEAVLSDRMDLLCEAVLGGKAALILDGCTQAILMETRGYEKRGVDRPQNESVVIGSQQGFIENLRSNITLIRRIIRSPMLITEMLTIGSRIPTQVALVYLKDVTDPDLLTELRRRIQSLKVEYVPDSGNLQSLIEDSSMLMIPQMLQTERPARAAHCLADGQIAIMMDNSPYALIAPITIFHLIHAADDSYMRWQYATFTRILRFFGLTLSLFLPGIYIALTTFHIQVLPLDLLTSIAEARARVPFPILIETLILELSFFMINEAGTRMPHPIGSALGIVGGLILGQAAVSADIISPILIIIVALSGLGNYVAPVYSLTIVLEILRLAVLFMGAFMGIYGVVLIAFVYLCVLCGARSLGVPMLSPFAPYRPHNPDLLLRLPAWMQKRLLFIGSRSARQRAENAGRMRGWKEEKSL